MNEPIISPWAVYLITRLDSIRGFIGVMICVAFLSPLILSVFAEIFDLRELKELPKRGFKMIAVASIVLAAGLAFLPSTKEAIMIYAASKVTPQTVQAAGDNVDKAIDKVIEKILMLSKQEDK